MKAIRRISNTITVLFAAIISGGYDNRKRMIRALKADNAYGALWEICYNLTKGIERKLESENPPEAYEVWELFADGIWDAIKDEGIDLDSEYS